MQKETKDKHFIKKPIYPGGLKAMRLFIQKEMKYPKEALENKIEGTVLIKYEVDHKGKVTSTKVIGKLGYGCDEEAQRIVSKFTFLVPKNPRKLRITFNKTIKINFKLPKTTPKQKAPPAQRQIQYTITPSHKKHVAPTPQKSGYTYTITINK